MNLAFYCEFYNDIERLTRAVTSLRKVYPDAILTLVSDGSERLDELELFRDETILVQSERMFTPDRGFDMFYRRLMLWGEMEATHVICFDTDALFHRPFTCEWNSAQPIAFGKLWARKDGQVGTRGGCYGLTSAAIQAMQGVDFGAIPPVKTYDRPGYEDKTIWVDNTMVDIYTQCFIRRRICCDFGVHVAVPPKGTFAVTHPHKDVDSD